nr:MAG TPA: hypothetical protein [Caudoviricetes sp.]
MMTPILSDISIPPLSTYLIVHVISLFYMI